SPPPADKKKDDKLAITRMPASSPLPVAAGAKTQASKTPMALLAGVAVGFLAVGMGLAYLVMTILGGGGHK
ncbi:MAG: hypothetical protein KDC14_01140, partial [Planctomycetes bacterium]|nr:hypothetical protein [Planctomycetota bacterium]